MLVVLLRTAIFARLTQSPIFNSPFILQLTLILRRFPQQRTPQLGLVHLA